MYSSRNNATRRKNSDTPKLVEVFHSKAHPLEVAASGAGTVMILGVSLSQGYSHGKYVGQTFDAIEEKFKQQFAKKEDTRREQLPHLIVLLSTAFDPANDPRFDINNADSGQSREAKQQAQERAKAWISEHTDDLNGRDFNYTIMSSDECVCDDQYQTILNTFTTAYMNGQKQQQQNAAHGDQQNTRSLSAIDSRIDIIDRLLFQKIKHVIEDYVKRHVTPSMDKPARDDLVQRSEWVVLREYALILMLFLRKVPQAFLDSVSLTSNQIDFAYTFGNFGKEVINLLKMLGDLNSVGGYNIKLPDFCNPSHKHENGAASAGIAISTPSASTPSTMDIAESPPEDKTILSFILPTTKNQLTAGFAALKSETARNAYLEEMRKALNDLVTAQDQSSIKKRSTSPDSNASHSSGSTTSSDHGSSNDSHRSNSSGSPTTFFNGGQLPQPTPPRPISS